MGAVHCCVACSIESQGNRECTDIKLVKMSTKPAVVLTCIFRRVLAALMHLREIRGELFVEMFGLDEELVEGILHKLEGDAIIVHRGDGCYKVDERILEKV